MTIIQDGVAQVARWLAGASGVDAQLLECGSFSLAVHERMRERACSTTAEYIALLEVAPNEREALVSTVAVPETWLFRYPESFALLIEHATTRLAEPRAELRLISVGSATGEEPIAMAIAALAAGWNAANLIVDAIEQNGALIERARRGIFGGAALRQGLPSWAEPYVWVDSDGAIRVSDVVLSCVRFHHASAIESDVFTSGSHYDAAFCRNVMIYLGEAGRARLMSRLVDLLSPGSLLCLGHAETVAAAGLPLRAVDRSMAFAFRRVARSPIGVPEALPLRPLKGEPSICAYPAPPFAIDPPSSRPPRETSSAARTVAAAPAPRAAIAPASTAAPVAAQSESSIERQLEHALGLADAGHFDEAETIVKKLHFRGAVTAAGFELLATISMARNNLEEARSLLERSIYLEPMRESSLLELSLVYEALGQTSRAQSCLNRVKRVSGRREEKP